MSCKDKYSNRSIIITNAKEVDYEGPVGVTSTLSDDCINQHEVNGDLYTIVDNHDSQLKVTHLSADYNTLEFTEVIKKYEEEIADLKQEVLILKTTPLCDLNILSCGIDFGDLSDDCGDPITTLGDALKALFNQHNQ
ncbi:structural protein [Cellulophaga phage phi4:1]|uniref:Structural protein n=5 Tax=Lightbulbvirus TaxID=1918522 RepID=A0A0S2MWE7_9CAUD|nr:structural protein [Cellulophaga phage phi4:1]YP_008241551.1 structural protein [Cellulophaga phage phi17:2]ALO80063.1 structural protein [Cellulophaga phage phi4:1_13]ALO80260.1 structural protein [Cellulophaga phage phi4:1_18]ALO80459.1 structural protein [Cellulophaga phage phi17:2_18]AGO47589.1 structural protein [Cellulophaga phage phi17:2]AGO49467.1 structural protein [Cellulophaga phage phi4:1]